MGCRDSDIAITRDAAFEAMANEAGNGARLGWGNAKEEGIVGRRVPALLQLVEPLVREGRRRRQVFLLKISSKSIRVGISGFWGDGFVEDVVDELE